MGKKFRDYDPNQIMLLPPILNEWLPDNHFPNFISDVVDHIDISAITKVYEEELRGYPPYHPAMLLKVLIYAYCTGVYSSRKIARACQEAVPFRILSANQFPDFRTISDFRKRHLVTFKELFLQVLIIAQDAGMIKLGHVALDGSKIKANASKHKAMSYDRMKQEEQRLRQEISELMLQAQRTDRREDVLHGNAQGDDLPGELARRESRLTKIQESMAALEKRAKVKAKVEKEKQEKEQQSKKDDDDLNDKAQRNFTDPESRIMRSKNGFVQAYNVQNVVDEAYQIIVATEVTDHPNDAGILRTMVEMTEQNAGRNSKKISCDTGYFAKTTSRGWKGKALTPILQRDAKNTVKYPSNSQEDVFRNTTQSNNAWHGN